MNTYVYEVVALPKIWTKILEKFGPILYGQNFSNVFVGVNLFWRCIRVSIFLCFHELFKMHKQCQNPINVSWKCKNLKVRKLLQKSFQLISDNFAASTALLHCKQNVIYQFFVQLIYCSHYTESNGQKTGKFYLCQHVHFFKIYTKPSQIGKWQALFAKAWQG